MLMACMGKNAFHTVELVRKTTISAKKNTLSSASLMTQVSYKKIVSKSSRLSTTEIHVSDSINQTEKELKENYAKILTNALAGNDVTRIIDDNVKLIDTYGNDNAELYRTGLISFTAFLSKLKENPTEAEKVVIKQKVISAVDSGNSIVTSQVGLRNVLNDTKILSKPENREFSQMVQVRDIMQKSVSEDPAKAYEAFSTKGDLIASKISHYAAVIEDFIKRNKIGKLTSWFLLLSFYSFINSFLKFYFSFQQQIH